LVLRVAPGVAGFADFDSWVEDHEADWARRQQRDEEVQLRTIRKDGVHQNREPEVNEIVGQGTHVSVAELVLTKRLGCRLAHEPHGAAANHAVDSVTTDLRRARHQPRHVSGDRRLSRSRHSRDDHASGHFVGGHAG
jgi:hypothetical protein